MGLFSGILKAVSPLYKSVKEKSLSPIISSVGSILSGGGNLASTALDIAGSLYSQDRNNAAAQSAANTAWSRSLGASNTAYQRAVADMRAAGLNPILAYSQGGASTPNASVASTTPIDLGSVGTRRVSNALSLAQLQNVSQSTRTGQANEFLQREQAESTRLNNEGLRRLPPEVRALGQMANNTGSSVVAAGHYAKQMYDHVVNPPKTNSTPSWVSDFERRNPSASQYRRR